MSKPTRPFQLRPPSLRVLPGLLAACVVAGRAPAREAAGGWDPPG